MNPAAPLEGPPILTLWRENRIDQQYQLTPEQIVNGGGPSRLTDPGFAAWLRTHNPRLNFDAALAYYLSDPSGRNSTWEPAELHALGHIIYDLARGAWLGYLDRITRQEDKNAHL